MPDLRADPADPHSAPTGAIRGMINMLGVLRKDSRRGLRRLRVRRPGPTFRDAIYPEYKANRAPMPDDLRSQIEPIHEVVACWAGRCWRCRAWRPTTSSARWRTPRPRRACRC
jgi:DNA polymerase-1